MKRWSCWSFLFLTALRSSWLSKARCRSHHSKRSYLDCRFLPPEAEAVAVLGDRIVAVERIHRWMPGAAPKLTWSTRREGACCRASTTPTCTSPMAERNSTASNSTTSPAPRNLPAASPSAPRKPPGRMGARRRLDETKWSPAELPTKELIDPATPETPVAIDRYDGHMVLANSLALKLAGITAQTPDPAGGVIVATAREIQPALSRRCDGPAVQSSSTAHSRPAPATPLSAPLAHAASVGVTSVQHMNPDYPDIAVYSELLDEGKLTTRIYAAPLITGVDDQVKSVSGVHSADPICASAPSRPMPTVRSVRRQRISSSPSGACRQSRLALR